MPELPDIENYCRYLKQHGLHKKIEGVTVGAPKILKGVSGPGLGRMLKGHSFERARRHGKHLLAAVDDGHWLAFHFGMTGRFEHFREGEEDPPYERLRFDFTGGEHLAYVNQRMLGSVELVEDADDFIRSKKLGPDAASIDEKTFRKRLRARRGAVKAALMDQNLFAGIGNSHDVGRCRAARSACLSTCGRGTLDDALDTPDSANRAAGSEDLDQERLGYKATSICSSGARLVQILRSKICARRPNDRLQLFIDPEVCKLLRVSEGLKDFSPELVLQVHFADTAVGPSCSSSVPESGFQP